MNLKEKTGEFLKGNVAVILMSISLFLIGITDSLLGLVLYTVIIHILCVVFFIGLYEPNFIVFHKQEKWIERQKRNNLFIRYIVVLLSASVIILVARGHWYLLIVTIIATILEAIHVIDTIRSMKTKQ